MLGWHITIYRPSADLASSAIGGSSDGSRLAAWQAGPGGLKWLTDLVKAGKAKDLGGDGYPQRYSVAAGDLFPQIAVQPPGALTTWMCGPSDILTDKWEGKTVIHRELISRCSPDEWLLVEAWDES